MDTFFGRISDTDPNDARKMSLLTSDGVKIFTLKHPCAFEPGDWVRVENDQVFLLTRCQDRELRWTRKLLEPRRIRGAQMRTSVEQEIRNFFKHNKFIETRTPLLVPCPGMETHIRPFQVSQFAESSEKKAYFLPTSPEFSMKKLLVGGLERIFQLSPVFRDEPESNHHLPEFTMLEWYRSFCEMDVIIRDAENLISTLARALLKKNTITYQNFEIDLTTPWPRRTVRSLFQEFTGVDLHEGTTLDVLFKECKKRGIPAQREEPWDDLYFKLWLNSIEPFLPKNRPLVVTHYPPSQAALAVTKLDSENHRWANRFEIYIVGVELANAFEELTDWGEQLRRFENDMKIRTQCYGNTFPITPYDSAFIQALKEGMPPCSGIALGVDRLIMLLANEPEIKNTFWLTPGELN